MSDSPPKRERPIPAPADLLDRMVRAVERVRERLRRAAASLNEAGIPYAVAGEQAVAWWVRRADEAAERFSPAVEILLNRSDLDAAGSAFIRAGFTLYESDQTPTFIDGIGSTARDAIRIVFTGDQVRADERFGAPDLAESERADGFRVVALEPLVRMKLASFRLIDRVNIRDLIEVGLVDESRLRSPSD
jgi:hypothetical protein